MDKRIPQMIMAIMCDGKSRSVPGLFSELNDMNGDIATHEEIKKALNDLHYPGWVVTHGLIEGRGNIEYYAFMKCEEKRKVGWQWFYIAGGVNDFKGLPDSDCFAYTDDGVNVYGSDYPLNTMEIMRKLIGVRVSVPDEVMEMAINQRKKEDDLLVSMVKHSIGIKKYDDLLFDRIRVLSDWVGNWSAKV